MLRFVIGIWFFFIFPLFVFSQKKFEPAELKYIGSSTVANFIEEADAALDSISFHLNTKPESAGGEQAILEGRTDLAGIARLPSQKILSSGVRSTLIGWDAIAVVVHTSNPVQNLSRAQLQGIFTGHITNWREVGGADLQIEPFIVGQESATRKVFRSILMGREDYRQCTVVRPDIGIIDKVSQSKGAIGQLSYSFLQGQDMVKPLRVNGQALTLDNTDYPITRPLYLLWWEGKNSIESFAQWARSAKGQELIMHRFIGIRNAAVQYDKEEGELVVYTRTIPMEDGGIFYYPHQGYEVLNSKHKRLLTVANHLSNNDETPTRVSLPPGQYIVQISMDNGELRHFPVAISPRKLTRLYPDINRIEGGAQEGFSSKEKVLANRPFHFFGDFRIRGEEDLRPGLERFRGRFRIRAGMFTEYNDQLRLELRLVSTGDPENPNSTHVDLSKGFDQIKVAFDRAFIRYNAVYTPGLTIWLGKFSNPNTPSNIYSEILWDADIQPEGLAVSLMDKTTPLPYRWTNALYLLSQFKTGAQPHALYTSQLTLEFPKGAPFHAALSSGGYFYQNIKGLDVNSGIIDRNAGNKVFEKRSAIGGDTTQTLHYVSNFYILNHFILFHFRTLQQPATIKVQSLYNPGSLDDNKGYVAGLRLGQLKEKGDWQIYYQYSWVDQEAVFTPYAQDDALAKSNMEMHVLGIAYNVHRKVSLNSWAFIDRPLTGTRSWEFRLRLDLNAKF